MEPLTWTASQKTMVVGINLGTAFMGITTGQYIVIACGLGIGIMARAAYLMSLRKPVWRDFAISIVMAPMNGVLAVELIEAINLHNGRLLLATSLLASSSTMIFVEARLRFLNWHGVEKPPTQIFTAPDSSTHVPSNSRAVVVTSVGENAPQTTGEVAISELSKVAPVTDHGGDLAALLHKLDKEPDID